MFDHKKFEFQGAIVRLRVRNFMTYEDVEMYPGPNLNIILGPNGTGKSAIVCSVIVGLAGEVGLTGRGASPADFVKKHTNSASTEIELYNDKGKNFIVERTITITRRTSLRAEHVSEWKINGKKVLKNDVKILTKKLNIKVDNLCQFLPQDSVTQFVKMNTCELLTNTLKAAGDNKLVDDHQKLIDFTKDVEEKRQTLAHLEIARQQNEVNARRLEAEVVQLRQRETLLKERKLCTQKIAYVQYTEALAQRDAHRELRRKLLEDFKSAEMKTEPSKHILKRRQSIESRAKEKVADLARQVPQAKEDVETWKQKIKEYEIIIQTTFSAFRAKQQREAERESEIKVRQIEINTLESKYEEYKELECEKKMDNVEKEMAVVREARKKNLFDKRDAENDLKDTVMAMDRLQKERDQILRIKDKKLQLLQSRNRDAFMAFEWLNRNKHRFQKHVYPPMLCEMDIKDPGNAGIVENAVPKNELMSFVCQTKEDLQTFTRAARDELKIKVSVVLAPTKKLEQFLEESHMEPHVQKSMGIDSFLIDLITAPEPILRYLCANQGFHKIPTAKEGSPDQFKILSAKFRRFYIGSQFYSITISRYDREPVICQERIREPSLLQFSLDAKRLRQCEEEYLELRKKHDALEAKQEEVARENTKLMEDWDQLAAKHKELNIKSDEKRRIEKSMQNARDFIKKREAEKLDMVAEKQKLSDEIDSCGEMMMAFLDKLMFSHKMVCRTRRTLMKSALRLRAAKRNVVVALKRLNRAKMNVSKLAEELKRADTRLKTFSAAKNEYKKVAEEKVPGFKDGELDRKTQERFSKLLENTVPQLKDKMDDLQVRISRIYHDANNSILKEFEKQNEQLKEKTSKIAQLTADIRSLETERQEIKRTWIPRLKDVIEAIDGNYRAFMQKLHYDGQVKLDFNESDPENFSVYGIQILVKYRDTDNLLPLSSTRQSGGERSVATMIYMLALQTKTTVPFRCVDEINQGMDKENERKVFELLIHTADSSSSQYFLVSPKLLNNLPYSEKMMIHVVFNGKNLIKGCWDNK